MVFIEDRERGFYDYSSTIDGIHFGDSCAYVLFAFRGGLYVVDVETHLIAALVEDGVRPIILLQQ